MPLETGKSQGAIGRNIARERHAGKPEAQAIAIAERKAGNSRSDAEDHITPFMDACSRGDAEAIGTACRNMSHAHERLMKGK